MLNTRIAWSQKNVGNPATFLPWRPIRMILPGARVVSAGGKQAMTPIFQGNPWTIEKQRFFGYPDIPTGYPDIPIL
jgi:hypothetical protein